MYHRTRWTPEKIKQRLGLITPLVNIKRKSLSSFRYVEAPLKRCPHLHLKLNASRSGASVDYVRRSTPRSAQDEKIMIRGKLDH